MQWVWTRAFDVPMSMSPTTSSTRTGPLLECRRTAARTARVVAKILMQYKLVDVPVNVVNKPGGSGTIGLNYLNQHPGDGHYMIVATTGSISNNILGLIPYNHTAFTPLSMLFEEYLGVNVRAESTIKTGRELVDLLKKNPEGVSFGISTTLSAPSIKLMQTVAAAMQVKDRLCSIIVSTEDRESVV